MEQIKKGYEIAKEIYAQYGIDVDKAIEICDKTPISIHCWQGDDVSGFEKAGGELTGGIQATGNYPGKARNAEELRADLELAMKFIPGTKKVNVHANYLEADGFVDRNEIEPEHYANWVDWAVKQGIGLDFNPTYFSHPKSENGTLSAADEDVRKFWIEHGIRCRRVGAYFAEKTGKPCVINHWTPDGDKEVPIDTISPRLRMKDSYDQIFEATKDVKNVIDGIESKVFGIGAESYTVGSHEFCMGYVMSQNKDHIILTLDTGHYHPTEVVSDKISSMLLFNDKIALHVTRPIRWDSDHVVLLDDETKEMAKEIVRNDALNRVIIGLDFFDASINRISAWVVGMRNMQKALMCAMLSPNARLKELQDTQQFTELMAMQEELKCYPFGDVWNYFCEINNVPEREDWFKEVQNYEAEVLSKRA